MVVHIYNPSYSRGSYTEDHGLRQAQTKKERKKERKRNKTLSGK
jgi:hypothetical protein